MCGKNLFYYKNWLHEAEKLWEKGQRHYYYTCPRKNEEVEINYPTVKFSEKGKTIVTVTYGVTVTWSWNK